MGDNIKNKAISGARWGFIENFSSLAVTFIIGIVLARILTPLEYGLVGYLTFFIAISISLIDNGFSTAIIKKSDHTSDDLKTLFSTNLSISILCYIIIFLLSGSIARFFHIAELKDLLRVLAIVLIINAFSIIQRVLLVKSVNFKKLTVCSLSSAIASGIVGIYMALNGCGAWALVGQQISKQLFNTIMLWLLGDWKLKIGFSVQSFKELFSYGSNVLISGLMDNIFKYLYYPVIGRHFATDVLGQYSRADQFSNVTSYNLSQVIHKVSFPIMSKVQDDQERLRQSFKTIVSVTILLSAFVCFTLSALAYPTIIGLVGEKWREAAFMLQIISLAGVFLPLQYLNQNILLIKGKMRQYLSLEIFKKILIILSVIIGFIYGLEVLLWGLVGVNILSYLVFAYYSGVYNDYPLLSQIKDILRPLLVSLICALIAGICAALFLSLCTNYLEWYNVTWTNIFATLFGIGVGGGCLMLFYYLYPAKEFTEAFNLIKIWKSSKN